MATNDQEYLKDLAKKADESRDNTFDSWLTDLR